MMVIVASSAAVEHKGHQLAADHDKNRKLTSHPHAPPIALIIVPLPLQFWQVSALICLLSRQTGQTSSPVPGAPATASSPLAGGLCAAFPDRAAWVRCSS